MRVPSTSYVLAIAACLAAGAAGGCVPTVYNMRPEVRGTVRDLSGAPIPGATVTVSDPAKPEGGGAATAKSDARGRFRVPPARKLGGYSPTADQREWTWRVQAQAPGHTPASVELEHRGKMPRQKFDGLKFSLPPK